MFKNKEQTDRTSQFCEFLVELTNSVMSAFAGKSEGDGEVGMDNGDGMEDLDDETIEMWRGILGEHEFALAYPHLV